MSLINYSNIPLGIRPTIPKQEQIEQIAKEIAKVLSNNSTIRNVALLAQAACATYGIINGLKVEEHIALC